MFLNIFHSHWKISIQFKPLLLQYKCSEKSSYFIFRTFLNKRKIKITYFSTIFIVLHCLRIFLSIYWVKIKFIKIFLNRYFSIAENLFPRYFSNDVIRCKSFMFSVLSPAQLMLSEATSGVYLQRALCL